MGTNTIEQTNGRVRDAGRRRDRNILSIKGLFTVNDVWKLFLSTNVDPAKAEKKAREKARVRLLQLCSIGKLEEAGWVQMAEWGVKRTRVFTTPAYRTKADWVTHDFMLWAWLRTVPNAVSVTGYECDQQIRTDIEAGFTNGLQANVEMDRDTESLSKVLERLDVLKTSQRKVLFITVSMDRLNKVKDKAAQHEIGKRMFFALWYDLIRDSQYHWIDCWNRKGRLYPPLG